MSAQFDLYSIVSRSPDMVVDEIDGELVMINLKEDAFYGFNDVGAEMRPHLRNCQMEEKEMQTIPVVERSPR